MIKGVDVSGYQSASSFSLSGLDFVFVKVTEGLSYINPKWTQQRDYAKAHGLVWGAYHYPHMANDPVAEADHFLAQVTWKRGDIIVLDWEGYDSANKNVSNAKKVSYRDAWLKHVKARMPDHRVGMYVNTDYWTNLDKTSNCGDFLWIATGGRAAGSPGITYPWTLHQYSTAKDIDHDVAKFESRAAMKAWAEIQEEDPMAGITPKDIYDAVWKTDEVAAPDTASDKATNTTWQPQSYLKDIGNNVRALEAKVDKLATGGVDLDALAKKVADLLAARLAD